MSLSPPFLKSLTVSVPTELKGSYPFEIPILRNGHVEINFSKPITIISGQNGVGKSSILEAIAAICGFSSSGGTKNYRHIENEEDILSKYMRLSWLPKVTEGFFFRAETFFNFSRTVDSFASETGEDLYNAYGGKSLLHQSHGESFLSLFQSRFGRRGIYLVDEPEAALSPTRLVDFIRILRKLDLEGNVQIIIVTHSPILMAYPEADFLYFENKTITDIGYRETEHFQIMQEFFMHPDKFMRDLLTEVDHEAVGEQL